MKKNPVNIHHRNQNIPDSALTIFGATGDLSANYLLPTLLHMEERGLLPKTFRLVCVGRRDFTADTYWKFMAKRSPLVAKANKKAVAALRKRLTYCIVDIETPESFENLKHVLAGIDKKTRRCYHRLYYFATAPEHYTAVVRALKSHGLLMACGATPRPVRVLLEKPFGHDEASAQALSKELAEHFAEDQVYRIDHYLGKETVQNLMVARFGNSIFEPLWNRQHIDHVEITALETTTAAGRGDFYDQTGALRDFVQNHLLQVLALVAMDEPKELTAEHIRDEKMKVLRSLVPFSPSTASQNLIRGQYKGYTKDVGHKTETETFVALKAEVGSERWSGVPFVLKTGKGLTSKTAEVSVHFKELDRCLFKGCSANVLTFRIQPDEQVTLQLNNKVPGFGIELRPGAYRFGYKEGFMSHIPSAYERLLLDFLEGDQRLFTGSGEVEAAWAYVDSVRRSWESVPLLPYTVGTAGPKESEQFAESFGGWATQ